MDYVCQSGWQGQFPHFLLDDKKWSLLKIFHCKLLVNVTYISLYKTLVRVWSRIWSLFLTFFCKILNDNNQARALKQLTVNSPSLVSHKKKCSSPCSRLLLYVHCHVNLPLIGWKSEIHFFRSQLAKNVTKTHSEWYT